VQLPMPVIFRRKLGCELNLHRISLVSCVYDACNQCIIKMYTPKSRWGQNRRRPIHFKSRGMSPSYLSKPMVNGKVSASRHQAPNPSQLEAVQQ